MIGDAQNECEKNAGSQPESDPGDSEAGRIVQKGPSLTILAFHQKAIGLHHPRTIEAPVSGSSSRSEFSEVGPTLGPSRFEAGGGGGCRDG